MRQDAEKPTHMDKLGEDNLARIFELLTRKERLNLELVCKRWNHVARTKSWNNYKIFDNHKFEYWESDRIKQPLSFIKKRCGRQLRHLTLRNWPTQQVFQFLSLTPNLQHLRLWSIKLDSEHLDKLTETLPNLRSLDLEVSLRDNCNFSEGLTNFLKNADSLEYLYIYETSRNFYNYRFDCMPKNLLFLALYGLDNSAAILERAAIDCKELKGLRITGRHTSPKDFEQINKLQGLSYLAAQLHNKEGLLNQAWQALPDIRAFDLEDADGQTVKTIAQYCKQLEHLTLRHYNGTTDDLSGLATLPKLVSVEISRHYSSIYYEDNMADFLRKLASVGKLQYVRCSTAPAKDFTMCDIVANCKDIASIDLLHFTNDTYSKLCRLVDEMEEMEDSKIDGVKAERRQIEVAVQRHTCPASHYKWLKFVVDVGPPKALDKWQYGWLSAGKPEWAGRYLTNNNRF